MADRDATMERLDDQIGWYDRKSMVAQRWYKRLKVTAVITAAIVPLAAGLGVCAWVTGGLGVLIVVLEALQQLNQFQHNWITYRSTCESLKHEKFLFLGQAGPYRGADDPHALLAERIEALVSQEHAKWVGAYEESVRKP